MNKKISASFAIIVILLVGGFLAFLFIQGTNQKEPVPVSLENKNNETGQKVCTQEAKQCPDGSYVSRTGQNCEFAACPEENKAIGGDKDEHGCLISAGYSWCGEKQKCLRTWEESCGNVDTKDWKAYKSEKYGFELKYPQDLFVINKSDKLTDSFELHKGSNNGAYAMSISAWSEGKKWSLAEREKLNKSVKGEEVTTENMTFRGVPALKTKFGGNSQTPSSEELYFIKDNKYFILDIGAEMSSLKDQILSAFKFKN